jgi:hypothetical protein
VNHHFRPKVSIAVAVIVSLTAAILYLPGPGLNLRSAGPSDPEKVTTNPAGSNENAAPGSCTIFTVAKGDTVFFGNYEDWINPNTYVWSRPAPRDGYGAVFFGFDDLYPQGEVNEKGAGL